MRESKAEVIVGSFIILTILAIGISIGVYKAKLLQRHTSMGFWTALFVMAK